MKFKRNPRLHPVTLVGLAFLAIAGITRMLLEQRPTISEHVVDPIVGFLYGIAIGAMLVGLWRQTGPRCPREHA
jgi:hypothetical protein